MAIIKIDRRSVEALQPEHKAKTYFDEKLQGFGVRVFPSGAKSWIVEYRPGSGGRRVAKKRLTLGRVSETLRADVARSMAKIELARVTQGADPARDRSDQRSAETVAEVIEAYLNEHIRPKRKAKSLQSFELLSRLHIKPQIGTRQAISITHGDVARLHRLTGKRLPTTANRSVELISAAWVHAIKTGILPRRHDNPAAGIERFKEKPRERLLSSDELAMLGASLRLAETTGLPRRINPVKHSKHAPKAPAPLDPYAIAAVRLLIFTGARLREILHLRWSEVDLERGVLRLPDSKTGAKTIVLSSPALELLSGLPRKGTFVIAGAYAEGSVEDQPRADLQRPWARIRTHAGLADVRLHDLRHAFASVGVASNIGLPIIGALLGHRHAATTARYAHLANDPQRAATDHIATTLELALNKGITS